ncbi:MAG TPA: GAF domain-containing protein [Gaiellaceae bacterium]
MEEKLDSAATVWELTGRLCEVLVHEVGGVACIVSRVIGDAIVQVAEYAADGRSYQLGRGFLVSEFPATETVLRTGEPCAVSVDDDDPDPAEVAVLRDLAVNGVLMLALNADARGWGLVEVYRGRPASFAAADIERAQGIVDRADARLRELVDRSH